MTRPSTKIVLSAFVLILLSLTGLAFPLLSQDDNIILTVAVREWQADAFRGDAFDEFEAANPGVDVVVETLDNPFFGSAVFTEDINEYFESLATYAGSADVLPLSTGSIDPVATRAGYFLDLSPLIDGDSSFDTSDFFPAIWNAFQWDRGIWAMPISASVQVLIYDATKFDEAGLAYPDPSWTFDDFANAARALTVYDDEGNVELPGFFGFNISQLMYGFLDGEDFTDDTTFPSQPDFSNPEIERIFTEYIALQEEGVFGGRSSGNVNFDELPMQISGVFQLSNNFGPGQDRDLAGTLLPGGTAILNTEGFGISSGTLYPELSYELLKFMSSDIAIVNNVFGDTPARRSLVGVEQDEEEQRFFRPELSDEAQVLLDEAIANGISRTDTLFGSYAEFVLFVNPDEALDITTALVEAEADAIEDLELAAAQRDSINVTVAVPEPTPVLSEGEVALKFRVSAPISPLPNREQWETLIDEFVAADPSVGHIELITGFGGGPNAEEVDCYYDAFNSIQFMDLENPQILNLDPFISTDPNFNPDGFVGDVLAQLERDGRTWGYPIAIQPQVLWYHQGFFEDAGLPEPEGTWTVEAFTEALPLLDSVIEADLPVFIPQGGNSHVLMLIAAFGGLPYDTRTDPPTVNLSDPTTIDAIQQALDLARDGYIEYSEMANFGGGGGFFGGGEDTALYNETLNETSFRIRVRSGEFDFGNDEPYPYYLTTFPIGLEYTPISYSVAAAYIDADTLYPEACYNWISTVGQTPGLFSAMPAQRAFLDAPEIAAQGEDLVAVYQAIDEMISAPNVINIRGDNGFGGYRGAFVEQFWVNSLFDNYVLEGADLAVEAAQVEADIAVFRECVDGIPEFTPDMEEAEARELSRTFADCAISIDPATEQFFFFPEDE